MNVPPATSRGEDLPQFYIPATTSLPERRLRTLKHGETFGLFDQYGDIVADPGAPDGIYHQDTRYLSRFEFCIDGVRPLLLSSVIRDDNVVLSVDLANPDYRDSEGRMGLARDTVHILRSKFLWKSVFFERIAVRNYDAAPHRFLMEVRFGADFADLFEARGQVRPRRGSAHQTIRGSDAVVLSYEGLDGIVRNTVIRFDPVPTELATDAARFDVHLLAGGRRTLMVAASFGESVSGEQPRAFGPALRRARRALRTRSLTTTAVQTSHQVFNEVLGRSIADLYMLMTDSETGSYPYAGIPWFATPFGRDGIITAMQLLWLDATVARGVLRFLARTQAQDYDPFYDAEPGKIVHEMRGGEMARLREVPFLRYYGGVDTTPLFIMLAGMYWARTGDAETARELWPHVRAALAWVDDIGDGDGDGFVEYQRKADSGLANQGWKDSFDSVFHADGRLADGPIALCEIQGYVYAARRQAAEMARGIGEADAAARLEEQAENLRRRFEDTFWDEDLGTYVLALDGDKQPCRVRTSNAGHLLFTGLASPERARRVADDLIGADLFSGWGIRTVAASMPRYNPISYHNGSVWPHDNALIAQGMARYGLTGHVQKVFGALFDAASYMELRRLPELFCGFRRRRGGAPTAYPVACNPQAWAAATPFGLLQACLGLEFDHANDVIRFHHPRLPAFLDDVVLRGLRLGQSRVDLKLRRYATDVTVEVLAREGSAHVAVRL